MVDDDGASKAWQTTPKQRSLEFVRTLVFLLLVSMSLVFACGTGEKEKETLTISMFQEKLCETRVTCGVYETFEDCMIGYLEYLPLRSPYYKAEQPIGQLLAEIEAGTILFDSTEAHKCLEAFSQECRSDVDLSACDRILEGTRPLEAPCFVDQECIGDAYCSGWDNRTCEPGTCVEAASKVGLGEQCGTADRASCEEGLICPGTDSFRTYCVRPQPIGSECPESFCETGAYCDTRIAANGECKPLPSTGEDCFRECLSLLDYCDQATNTCLKRGQMDDDCNGDAPARELSQSPCPLSGFCLGSGVDVCLPLGENCSNSGHCLTGYYCNGTKCIYEGRIGFTACNSAN